ncbi:hypothetical protein A6769_27435 [Nostoc punctiforme NIES-2108]|uniref:Uncharacterized protein n=1 Tax=Nostoc punctiforme NIES-2108 TaxID=1356359 RepID=A0A367R910_NOSPU|nr:hypothetical protein A6769_27435 [Nostoc punctiforme NIES-2108]
MTLRVEILKDKFNQSLGLPFKELLPASVIEQAMEELKIRYYQRLFDPIILDAHVKAIAKILYKNTPPSKIETFEGIETTN